MPSGHTYFCLISFRPIQENENVDHAPDCANLRSQKSKAMAEKRDGTDRISAVFTQVRRRHILNFELIAVQRGLFRVIQSF